MEKSLKELFVDYFDLCEKLHKEVVDDCFGRNGYLPAIGAQRAEVYKKIREERDKIFSKIKEKIERNKKELKAEKGFQILGNFSDITSPLKKNIHDPSNNSPFVLDKSAERYCLICGSNKFHVFGFCESFFEIACESCKIMTQVNILKNQELDKLSQLLKILKIKP